MATQFSDEEEDFDAELFKDAWDWLYVTHPRMADKLAILVQRGWKPERFESHVIRTLGVNRQDLAKRCENAARYLIWAAKQ